MTVLRKPTKSTKLYQRIHDLETRLDNSPSQKKIISQEDEDAFERCVMAFQNRRFPQFGFENPTEALKTIHSLWRSVTVVEA
ncbi:MAG: hypothetical protein ACFFGZ_06445 [Candidatus Thorarchaeota archaeon]